VIGDWRFSNVSFCMTISLLLHLTFAALVLAPPVDVSGYVRAGDAAYEDFRTRDAIGFYTRAYEADPKSYEVLSRLARAWSDLGRLTLRRTDSSEVYYRRALGYAQELVDAHPDSSSSWFLLALCHGSLTPFKSLTEKLAIAQDVEKNALRSLQIDPNHSMTHVLLGIYYRGVSRLSWLERTIVNGILGREINGTLEDAERHLLEALDLDPNNSFAYFELHWIYRSSERPMDAAEALRKVLACEPTNERELQQHRSAEARLKQIGDPSAPSRRSRE